MRTMRKEIQMMEVGNQVAQRGVVMATVCGVGQGATGAADAAISEGASPRVRIRRCREVRRATSPCAQGEAAPVVELGHGLREDRDLAQYRKYTEALLRRYQRLKLQAGGSPSRMDREVFRGRMSHYKVEGFDDAVIFCVDVERCLQRLNAGDERLVRRIAVQEYSMGEAAGVLGMSLRSCIVLYRRALDRVTRLFLAARLLSPEKSCQEREGREDRLSA